MCICVCVSCLSCCGCCCCCMHFGLRLHKEKRYIPEILKITAHIYSTYDTYTYLYILYIVSCILHVCIICICNTNCLNSLDCQCQCVRSLWSPERLLQLVGTLSACTVGQIARTTQILLYNISCSKYYIMPELNYFYTKISYAFPQELLAMLSLILVSLYSGTLAKI